MIPITNPDLFALSRTQLATFAGYRYQGRFVQILLGLKCFGGDVPDLGNGWIGTGQLEERLDDLYAKQSRPEHDRVISLFSNSFLRPSGHVGAAHNSSANNWRNNFNAQKGISCYATEAELCDLQFLEASRADCPHLIPGPVTPLAHGRCEFHPTAQYRGDDHIKILRKDPQTDGFSAVELSNFHYLRRIVLNARGERIPIIPLICALYTDATIASGRAEVDTIDFCLDFDLSPEEYAAYFDEDLNCPAHREILQGYPEITFTPLQHPAPPPAWSPPPPSASRPPWRYGPS